MKNCNKVKAVSKTGVFLNVFLNIKVNTNEKIEQILKQFLKKIKNCRVTYKDSVIQKIINRSAK